MSVIHFASSHKRCLHCERKLRVWRRLTRKDGLCSARCRKEEEVLINRLAVKRLMECAPLTTTAPEETELVPAPRVEFPMRVWGTGNALNIYSPLPYDGIWQHLVLAEFKGGWRATGLLALLRIYRTAVRIGPPEAAFELRGDRKNSEPPLVVRNLSSRSIIPMGKNQYSSTY